MQAKTLTGPVEVTREQLAGKIYGIDYIMTLVERILGRGEQATSELKRLGINIS